MITNSIIKLPLAMLVTIALTAGCTSLENHTMNLSDRALISPDTATAIFYRAPNFSYPIKIQHERSSGTSPVPVAFLDPHQPFAKVEIEPGMHVMYIQPEPGTAPLTARKQARLKFEAGKVHYFKLWQHDIPLGPTFLTITPTPPVQTINWSEPYDLHPGDRR